MLIAIHLACVEHRPVLVFGRRRQEDGDDAEGMNWVVFLDGNGHVARRSAVPDDAMQHFTRDDPRLRSVVTLAVGFEFEMLPRIIRSAWHLVDLFVPEGPYAWTNKDSGQWASQWCLLPAWRFEDLLEYAKQSNWSEQTSVSGTRIFGRKALYKLVKTQFFYSGGSLRGFCTHAVSRLRGPVDPDAYRVRSQEDEPIQLLAICLEKQEFPRKTTDYCFYYLPERENHYLAQQRRYPGIVDSGHKLAKMGPLSPTRALFEVYYMTKLLGLPILYESTFKLFIHGVLRETTVHRQPVVAQLVGLGLQPHHRLSSMASLSICPTAVQHASDDRATQIEELQALPEGVYWCHFGPPGTSLVDAVVTCQALGPQGDVLLEAVVVLIKIATSHTMKPIKRDRWQQVNAALDRNPHLAAQPRVELLVTADARTAERGVSYANTDRPSSGETTAICLVDPLALLLHGKPERVKGATRRSILHYFLEDRPSESALLLSILKRICI